jgi:hypothetical protein
MKKTFHAGPAATISLAGHKKNAPEPVSGTNNRRRGVRTTAMGIPARLPHRHLPQQLWLEEHYQNVLL